MEQPSLSHVNCSALPDENASCSSASGKGLLSPSDEAVYRMFFAPSPPAEASSISSSNASSSSSSYEQLIKHRKRTSREQLQVLEKSFSENPRPSSEQRKELAMLLDMTPRGVQIWFQNRRAKLKTKTRDEEHFNSLRRSKELGLISANNPNILISNAGSSSSSSNSQINASSSSSCVNSGGSSGNGNLLNHHHHHLSSNPNNPNHAVNAGNNGGGQHFPGRISSILTPQLSPMIPSFYGATAPLSSASSNGGPCGKASGLQGQHHHPLNPYPMAGSGALYMSAGANQQGPSWRPHQSSLVVAPPPPSSSSSSSSKQQQRCSNGVGGNCGGQSSSSSNVPSSSNASQMIMSRDVMHDIEEAILNSNFDFFKKENSRNATSSDCSSSNQIVIHPPQPSQTNHQGPSLMMLEHHHNHNHHNHNHPSNLYVSTSGTAIPSHHHHPQIYYDPFAPVAHVNSQGQAKRTTFLDPSVAMFAKHSNGGGGGGSGTPQHTSGLTGVVRSGDAGVNAEELLSEYINYANN